MQLTVYDTPNSQTLFPSLLPFFSLITMEPSIRLSHPQADVGQQHHLHAALKGVNDFQPRL